MKLAIILARKDDLPLALQLTAAARRAGDLVAWFVMADGVTALVSLVVGPHVLSLDEVDVIACATSVDQQAIQVPTGVRLGSQDDHAALLAWADRTVALT
jgi:hypothetical protein